MRSKGLIDIYILEILERHSSKKHKVSQKEIMYYLDVDYNLRVSRKTLSGYLRELREYGYIQGERGIYINRKFDDHELRVLIDGVLFGKHVPEVAANELINKLMSMSYDISKHKVKHMCYLSDINHTKNEQFYEIVDEIYKAIEENKKIEIVPCVYGVDGKLYDKEARIVSPYYLVTEMSHYYLICFAGRNDDLENRRVDRISNVKILNEKRKPLNKLPKYRYGFDLGKYMREHIYMFSGDSIVVVLKIRADRIGDFIDWYGKDYVVLENRGEYLTIRVNVNENAVYYWAIQYGDMVEIMKPLELRNRMIEGLKKILNKYALYPDITNQKG